MMKKAVFLLMLVVFGLGAYRAFVPKTPRKTVKLYWFIPDGVRAEPGLFNVYQWAREGKLPNIKKLMDMGSYGYAYPNFPSHTPTNFATLLTGAYPEVHGVNDGPMRVVGKPLDKVAVPGFRSSAKKVSPIWKTLEDAGLKVALLSVPGSTPPETQKGVVLRGRWGGWGADFAALNFETKGDLSQRVRQGRGARFFYFGPQLTEYVDAVEPTGWQVPVPSFSPPKEIVMSGWGAPVYGYLVDSTDNGKTDYDKIALSTDKKTVFATLSQGMWSDWADITLKWKAEDKTVDVPTKVKVAAVKIGADGFFRVRLYYDNLNPNIAVPSNASEVMHALAGPMVDFPDNFPAQLVYYPEDKKIFLDEQTMSFDWHTKAVGAVVNGFSPDVVIHDIYSPNQMLTSRWWMGGVDPKATSYGKTAPEEHERLWAEVQDMYKRLDGIVGEMLKVAGKDSYIVFSSDHGNVPLNRYVNLNNLFAKNGWLKFTIDPKTGEPVIDWQHSKVIYLKMAHVWINPAGLAGDFKRASGPQYEKLRDDVKRALVSLADDDGTHPVTEAVEWERAKEFMRLDPDRAGDLVLANAPGWGWNEEMSADLALFSAPLISGYKQAIESKDVTGMWTPFIIAGPGIKRNHSLGNTAFELIHEYPTIMKALGVKSPEYVQGKPLDVFR